MKPHQIKGNCVAKRACEVAAVGNLAVLFIGPLSTSKTTMRDAFPSVCSAERETCSCGHNGDVRQECRCNDTQRSRWARRLERDARAFPIVIEMCGVPTKEMMASNMNTPETDEWMSARIAKAREFGVLNTSLELSDDAARRTVEMASRRLSLTYGQYNYMLAVARAIANLDQSPKLMAKHIAEAVQYSAVVVLRNYDATKAA